MHHKIPTNLSSWRNMNKHGSRIGSIHWSSTNVLRSISHHPRPGVSRVKDRTSSPHQGSGSDSPAAVATGQARYAASLSGPY